MTDAGRAQAQAQAFRKQVDVTEIQRLELGQKEVELAQTDAANDVFTASGPGINACLNHQFNVGAAARHVFKSRQTLVKNCAKDGGPGQVLVASAGLSSPERTPSTASRRTLRWASSRVKTRIVVLRIGSRANISAAASGRRLWSRGSNSRAE